MLSFKMIKSVMTVSLIMSLVVLSAGCGVKNTAQTYITDVGFQESTPCFEGKRVAVLAHWSPEIPTEPVQSHPYIVTGSDNILERTKNSGSKLNESGGGKALLASIQLENQFQYMLADAIENAGITTDLVVFNRNAFTGMTGEQLQAEKKRLEVIIQKRLAKNDYDYVIISSNRQKLPGAKSILEIDSHAGGEAIRGFLTLGFDKLVASDTDTHTYTWDREVKVIRLSDGKTVYEKTFRTNETRDIEVHEGSFVKVQSKFEETAKFQGDIHKNEVRRTLKDITQQLGS